MKDTPSSAATAVVAHTLAGGVAACRAQGGGERLRKEVYRRCTGVGGISVVFSTIEPIYIAVLPLFSSLFTLGGHLRALVVPALSGHRHVGRIRCNRQLASCRSACLVLAWGHSFVVLSPTQGSRRSGSGRTAPGLTTARRWTWRPDTRSWAGGGSRTSTRSASTLTTRPPAPGGPATRPPAGSTARSTSRRPRSPRWPRGSRRIASSHRRALRTKSRARLSTATWRSRSVRASCARPAAGRPLRHTAKMKMSVRHRALL